MDLQCIKMWKNIRKIRIYHVETRFSMNKNVKKHAKSKLIQKKGRSEIIWNGREKAYYGRVHCWAWGNTLETGDRTLIGSRPSPRAVGAGGARCTMSAFHNDWREPNVAFLRASKTGGPSIWVENDRSEILLYSSTHVRQKNIFCKWKNNPI